MADGERAQHWMRALQGACAQRPGIVRGERTAVCQALAPLLGRHLRDQPRAALEGDVVPEPGECDDEAVAQPDQKIDVHERPEQPGDEALKVDATELYHRAAPADRG